MIEARGVNHIGIAVRSLAAHRDFYERVLGAIFEGVEEVPSQKVRVAFYRLGSGAAPIRLELLEPTAEDSPVARFLEKRGEGVHHIAYTVDDLEARLRTLGEAGVRRIDETPRPGAHDMRIAFLHPKSTGGVLTELCEPPGEVG
ncbi:MAG: methylmalonyl-CoA epimerase [Gemmatimonadetes bacterium]|nr:methylmalonyl-CoA epimerase [Gemmatimonadota bacterium]NIQ52330.1 methylmalonyl-CoA epimerase [Gemmatimonadota bacterium]NIU72438.1 methylmalonyl-CoA epimerase [Gammaproteobacteria bacterium]NIX42898.1 methylmalonyl-CoA epimerase [Gemmatimonadota bacterium]NIY07077.1 methylmalonyl-CoA epimerase [Gemmatimonadota bacterium]